MKHESWSIAMACLLGAFVGAFIALDISARFAYGQYFWALGALAGGLVAYVAVDAKSFVSGIARAYRATAGWQPNWHAWRAAFALSIGISMLAMSCAVSGAFGAIVVGGESFKPTFEFAFFVWGAVSLFMSFFFCLATAISPPNEWHLKENETAGWGLARHTNPVSLVFWTLFGLCRLLARTPAGALALLRFVRLAFVLVHSEIRVLCFVDAALGACIGYFAGSAILGAIAGAALGIANYELVSVRWLKLVPNRSRS